MDWRFNTICFDKLEQHKFYQKDFKENQIIEDKKFVDAEYAIIWYLRAKKQPFDNLDESDKLLYLELNWANNKDFIGIEKFKTLKRLELHYCTKLENDNGLGKISDSIEHLHINQSKKFQFSDELLQLGKLKVLCLNSCAPIESLDFLMYFPNLIDFRFVDTNILNGNLNPILEHPTIRNVGFLNKRHYNYKDEIIKLELDKKIENDNKIIVSKD